MYTEDSHLAYQVGKIGERLREDSPNKHALRSQLIREWDNSVKIMIEPSELLFSKILFLDMINLAC